MCVCATCVGLCVYDFIKDILISVIQYLLFQVWCTRPGGLLKKPSMLVWDQFRAHLTDKVKQRASSSGSDSRRPDQRPSATRRRTQQAFQGLGARTVDVVDGGWQCREDSERQPEEASRRTRRSVGKDCVGRHSRRHGRAQFSEDRDQQRHRR